MVINRLQVQGPVALMLSQIRRSGKLLKCSEVLVDRNILWPRFQLPAVDAVAGRFVCADSGVMHLAASARVKVVGLFSHTDPLTCSPLSATGLAINPGLGTKQVALSVLS
jgi:hypothetical protein